MQNTNTPNQSATYRSPPSNTNELGQYAGGEGQGFQLHKTSIGRAIAFGCANRCHLSVHRLALPRPGSGDDSRGGGTATGVHGGGSRGGRRHTSGDANLSERGGIPCLHLCVTHMNESCHTTMSHI